MIYNSGFKEPVYCVGQGELIQETIDTINETLLHNKAVGIVCCKCEERAPLFLISDIALSNIGYTYDEFYEKTCGDVIEIVHPSDQTKFLDPMQSEKEYRILHKNGAYIWVKEIRKYTKNRFGEDIWIGSVRLNDELHQMNLLNQELIASLSGQYDSIYRIDIATEKVKCLKEKILFHQGEDVDYKYWLDETTKNFIGYDRTQARQFFDLNRMSKGEFGVTYYENYRSMIKEEIHWISVSIYYTQTNETTPSVIVTMKDSTKEHMFDNALHSVIHNYSELIYIQLDKDYYHLICSNTNNHSNDCGKYSLAIQQCYLYGMVHFDDHQELMRFLSKEAIQKNLMKKSHAEIQFRRLNNEGFYELCEASLDTCEIENNHVSAVVLSIKSLDEYALQQEKEKKVLNSTLASVQSESKAKTLFLKKMTEAINDPMHSILGTVDVLDSNNKDTKMLPTYLQNIRGNGHKLMESVKEILDLSRIETGKIVFVDSQFNIIEILEDVLFILKSSFLEKKITFQLHIDNIKEEIVIGDAYYVKRLLYSLLQVSISKAREGGYFDIYLSQKPFNFKDYGQYEFNVIDSEVTLSREEIRRLLQPNIHNRNANLSIAIAEHVVDMMHGELNISSYVKDGTNYFTSFLARRKTMQIDEAFHTFHVLNKSRSAILAHYLDTLGVDTTVRTDCRYTCVFVDSYNEAYQYTNAIVVLDVFEELKDPSLNYLRLPLSKWKIMKTLSTFKDLSSKTSELELLVEETYRVVYINENHASAQIVIDMMRNEQLDVDWFDNQLMAIDIMKTMDLDSIDIVLLEAKTLGEHGGETICRIREMSKEHHFKVMIVLDDEHDSYWKQYVYADIDGFIVKPITGAMIIKECMK